jgi:predicted amidohydrolase
MAKISVALAQICIHLGDTAANLSEALALLEAHPHTDLFLLPELWSSGYDLPSGKLRSAENRLVLDELRQVSAKNNQTIGGSLLTRRSDLIFNDFHLLSAGTDVAQYQKLHLFRLMQEEQYLTPGSTLAAADLPWGRVGLAICYDLRFPELFRSYALGGAKCILLVSEWPLRRIEHWKTLLRARAIENQVFIIAVNSVGKTGDEEFGGCSAVIGPWGETIAEASSTEEMVLTAEIDLAEVDEIRRRIPIFKDRRTDIYGSCTPT